MKIILPTILIISLLRLQFVISTSNNSFVSSSFTRFDDQFGKYKRAQYKQSVHNLLRTLAYQADSSNTTGFFNSFQYPDQQLYGLYMCRGDLDPKACRDCINLAKKNIVKKQLYGNKADVWYDHCLVRYSNEPFFGKLDEYSSTSIWGKQHKKNADNVRFAENLTRAMNGLVVEAAFNDKFGNSKRFSTKVVRLTKDQSLYALAQCTPDLTSSDCHKCLMKAVDNLQRMKGRSLSGKVMRLNCMIRYETFPFFEHQQIKSLRSSS